jgi:predicted nucleic acid-binding protein
MYVDTCTVVKLFTTEPDSAHYAELVEGQTIVSSALLLTETWSALLAKERNKLITPAERKRAWKSFEDLVDAEVIRLIPLTVATFRKANRIMEQVHPDVPLRTLDALHLAASDQAQEWPLCTSDKRMRDSADRLNYPLTPLYKK